ncbi:MULTISPECIES: lysylphosphatidylglycerol synthase domain-containing protein [unclassified Chelatococcus]|uniref:lysylphosphatidylglycerol synthase domain-containing protein n=1 Tax=unclassified Chelatococcus TaxID=2638111 RepID=UPI001BD13B43|nr:MULTISPECIES: lysylphosphatidylglycerol synthase domain-containing protein [unclassified Chelatococcus]MBS7697378.1 UPF0104 family protein [Chelatococcus sp. YT9]MBX3556325.1 UPF0104 family protein [Chelatococcus sp.]
MQDNDAESVADLDEASPAKRTADASAADRNVPAVPASRDRETPADRRRRRLSIIGTVLSAALFLGSFVVLWRILGDIDLDELSTAFRSASERQITIAIALTAVSYLLLTGYDYVALKQLGERIAYRVTAFASFTSYAISFTLGFPLVTGGTVRYWVYSPHGIKAAKIASLTVIAGITFWLGMSVVLSWSLVRHAAEVSVLAKTGLSLTQLAGVAGFAALAAYFIWVTLKHPVVNVRGWRLELPRARLSFIQMLIGAGDVCAAAGVLFVLLPGGHGLSYETFLAVYVVACMLGIASHAPGGIGVFEATILIALDRLPTGGVLGALLLFRLLYYLVPFVMALTMLFIHEARRRVRRANGKA